MKKYFENIDWKRWGKIALVILPVLIWDVFYFLVKLLYKMSNFIDKKGEVFFKKFMEM